MYGRASQREQSLEKVGFTQAVRQPQAPTNSGFLRGNGCTYTMKLITIHVYILSRVVNSHLLPLSEKDILSLRSNRLGKRGYYYTLQCANISVGPTFRTAE